MENFISARGYTQTKKIILPPDLYNMNFNRVYKISLFKKYFCNHKQIFNLPSNAIFRILQNAEKKCFNETIKSSRKKRIPCSWDYEEFIFLYHLICGKLLGYIDCSINAEKADQILKSIIHDPEYNIPNMIHREIHPEEYLELEKRQNADDQMVRKFCTLYTCPKCRKRLCTLKNRYNRSLDEGVNLMATCVWCNTEWGC